MACIYVKTWQDTYLSVIPFDYLSSMSIPRHEKAFLKELNGRHIIGFVAEEDDRIIGFTTGGYERNGDDIYTGEIYTLYVLKHFQRQGAAPELHHVVAVEVDLPRGQGNAAWRVGRQRRVRKVGVGNVRLGEDQGPAEDQ